MTRDQKQELAFQRTREQVREMRAKVHLIRELEKVISNMQQVVAVLKNEGCLET